MRVTTKAIDQELGRRGFRARIERGDGYFYFSGDDTSDWLDRTVSAATLNSLSLDQWLNEFERLKKLNEQLLGGPNRKHTRNAKATAKRK